MKYYSEITKRLYDTKDELVKAEVEVTKNKSERAAAEKKVNDLFTEAEKLREEAEKANKAAKEALADFNKKYGGTFKWDFEDKDNNKKISFNSTVLKPEDNDFWDMFTKYWEI